jgi:hypothetical protein
MTVHALTTLSDSVAVRLSPVGIHSGVDITLQNVNATAYVYVGNESVTTSNYGFRIMPNHSISWELSGSDSLYAVSNINGSSVAVIQTSLEAGF